MPSYEFVTVDVFTDRRFGGNPLAVFPDARGLSDADMQALAAEFNLSETTFVLPPDNPAHTARVRIFTPKSELPFAGHPNVGTGFVLARRMERVPDHLVFEEEAGLVRVQPQRDEDGSITGASIAAPQSLQIGIDVPEEVVAECAELDIEDIVLDSHQPLVASTGGPFLLAEVAGNAALARARPSVAAFLRAAHETEGLPGGLLLYVRQGGDATRLRTRMFAPALGVMEDPATGSANATLAALLTSLAPGENVDLAYDIEQGIEMGRPSRLLAHARKTAEGPVTARIAGGCVPVMRGFVDL